MAVEASSKRTDLKVIQKAESDTIDLVALFRFIMDKWYQLLCIVLVGLLLGGIVSFFLIKPTYTSTSKLYVVSSSGDSAVDLTDLNIGTSLTNDYRELIMSYPVLEVAMNELKLDMSLEDFSKMIELTNPTNTRIICITVNSNDPELSCEIANTVAGVAQDYLPETMSTVRPNVAQVAKVPTQKSAPSFSQNAIIGGLLAGIIYVCFRTFKFMTDDTVKSLNDWENAFDLPILAVIPDNRSMNDSANNQRTRNRRVS